MKKIVILSLSIILSFSLGFYLSKYIDNCSTQIKNSNDVNDTFAAGWEAAKKRLEKTGHYFMIDTTFPIKEIWGEITNITSNKLTISIQPLDPLADSSLDKRIIIVDDSTVLLQQIKKSDSVYSREVAEYNNKYQDFLNGPILPEDYPNMFTERPISIEDLKIGQKIKVVTDYDIRNIKEFRVLNILIQYPDN